MEFLEGSRIYFHDESKLSVNLSLNLFIFWQFYVVRQYTSKEISGNPSFVKFPSVSENPTFVKLLSD